MPDETISLRVSREELAAVLNLVDIPSLPGMGENYLEGLNEENEQALVLAGRHALRAHRLDGGAVRRRRRCAAPRRRSHAAGAGRWSAPLSSPLSIATARRPRQRSGTCIKARTSASSTASSPAASMNLLER